MKEVAVPDGYKVTVNDKDKANIVLTNTHEPALTEMKVTKKWEDANNQDGLRPKSIKVQLYAGDEKVAKANRTATYSISLFQCLYL